MGIRTPSLYVYFDAKHAVFAPGWEAVHKTMTRAYDGVYDATDLQAYFLSCTRMFVG